MEKIFDAEGIRAWDEASIHREGITSINLMERAAMKAVEALLQLPPYKSYHLLCGRGNNGGDGLAIAAHLHQHGHKVKIFILGDPKESSSDFAANFRRVGEMDLPFKVIQSAKELDGGGSEVLWVDALFGSGLNRPLDGLAAELVHAANAAEGFKVSIDIPSGHPVVEAEHFLPGQRVAFRADLTLTFQQWKPAFFFPECGRDTGRVEVLDIGLDKAFYHEQLTPFFRLDQADARSFLNQKPRFSHKGSNGHLLLIAGSKGMFGAAILASKAALRSGVGLVSVCVPDEATKLLHQSCPEALVHSAAHSNHWANTPELDAYTAVAVGPGIGQHDDSAKALGKLLQNIGNRPLLLDADALNLLSKHRHLFEALPGNWQVLLTPHPGEFDRLFGPHKYAAARLDTARKLAEKHEVVIHLKGAYSCTISAQDEAVFNPTGSAAMAIGGSGDVLTGLASGLLAQGLKPREAALLGAWVHGAAGAAYEAEQGVYGLTAGCLSDWLWKGQGLL